MSDAIYYQKYLKYKIKYANIKNQLGGVQLLDAMAHYKKKKYDLALPIFKSLSDKGDITGSS
jgi:hypothetical protein